MLKRAQSTDGAESVRLPQEADEKLSCLVHDLANLVQAVSGNLELLAERTTDETSRSFIANASEAARRLAHMTHGLREETPSRLQRRA